MNFRGRQYLQDQSDVFNILQDSPSLSAELDKLTLKDDADDSLQSHLLWRADHLGTNHGFWNDVQSDLPWQLDEGIRSNFSKLEVTKDLLAPKIGKQMLSRHPIYSEVVLVRDHFRYFPRTDGCLKIPLQSCRNPILITLGFLLTTSPAVAFNELTAQLERGLKIPPSFQTVLQDYSTLGFFWRGWKSSRTASWSSAESVHWLMVLLIIELEVTPYNGRLQNNVPDIQNAYLPIVRDLVRTKPLITSVAKLGLETPSNFSLQKT